MGGDAEDGQSLDIVARTPELAVSLRGLIVDGGDGDISLDGTLFSPTGEIESLPVTVNIDRPVLEEVRFEPVDAGLLLSYEDGESAHLMANYTAASVLNERYEFHSAIVTSEEGNNVDVFAIADPIPIFIVGAGILAAACLVGGGVSWLVEWVQTHSTGQAQACRDRGLFPKIGIELDWKFSLRRLELGCKARPVFKCQNSNGETISEERGEWKSVHDLSGSAA